MEKKRVQPGMVSLQLLPSMGAYVDPSLGPALNGLERLGTLWGQ